MCLMVRLSEPLRFIKKGSLNLLTFTNSTD
jgi:hypothetical protein